MNCQYAQQNLKAYLDGELGLKNRFALRVHMRRCSACRSEADTIRSLSMQLAALSAPRESGHLRDAIVDAARRFRSTPATIERRRARPWLLPAAGVAVLCVVLGYFLFSRSNTAQAAFNRVLAAAGRVRSAHFVWINEMPDGRHETAVVWYLDGKFRADNTLGKGDVYIYDGKRLHTYDPQSNVAFINISDKPSATPFRGFTATAWLDKAIGDPALELKKVRGPDGRRLNRFVADDELERTVILADEVTDLPIEVRYYARAKFRWRLVGRTTEIDFNGPVDLNLFILRPPENALIIDKEKWDKQWRQRYEQGLARVKFDGQEAILRDFQVTTTGDIYAIWTPGGPTGVPGPYAELTDSLGTVYLKVREGFQAGKDPCAMFVPLAPAASEPKWYLLTAEIEPEGEPRGQATRTVTFRIEHPVFSPLEGPLFARHEEKFGQHGFLYPSGPEATILREQTRAEDWKAHENPLEALRHYEKAIAVADRELQGRLHAATWLEIGTLYENVGKVVDARKAYQRGLKNVQNPDYEKREIEALRAGLKRTR